MNFALWNFKARKISCALKFKISIHSLAVRVLKFQNFKISVRPHGKIFKILKKLGLAGLWRAFASKDAAGMSKTMYETLKNVVNEDFRDIFSALSPQNALIFWGKDDRATSLKSGELIHSLVKNSKFYPLMGDHFFFLQSADFIGEQIEKELSGS